MDSKQQSIVTSGVKLTPSILCIVIVLFSGVGILAAWSQTTTPLFTLGQFSQALNTAAEGAIPTVVFVQVEKTVGEPSGEDPFSSNNPFDLFSDELLRRFFGQQSPRPESQRGYRQMEMGSGFIISSDGVILTSNHVVGEANSILVRLSNGKEFRAQVIGTDPPSDVAVIKINNSEALPALPLGDSDALLVGELVMAIGNPFGLSQTLTTGIVSAKGRANLGIADYEDFIQTDASINPGNSGGPLINMRGEAIGVNTAIFSQSGGNLGIGFAVPINMVKAIMNQLIEHGVVSRGFLGVSVQTLTDTLRESFNLADTTRGVIITNVMQDSPADKAGLKRGDIITGYTNQPIEEAAPFRNLIAMAAPGSTITLTLIRDKEEQHVPVTLGALKSERPSRPQKNETTDKLGLTVEELTPEIVTRLGYQGLEGVVVTRVASNSLSAAAGLEPDMLISEVNKKPISSVDEFLAEIRSQLDKKQILLFVHSGTSSQYLTVPLG
ncbi:MAG TPA: DegQ family serine endoprotease [Thermodesulfobacteriota bacterium]|nr:DegQ family serine endoprotease [Thermodesulfobacteriota bacterium]